MASVSLLSAQVAAAQTAPIRIGAPIEKAQELRGRVGGGTVLISLLALTTIILTLIIVIHSRDRPNSP